MNILLLEPNEVDLAASDVRVGHVRKVLKLGVGGRLRAGIVNGVPGTAVIESLDERHMRVRFEPDERSALPGRPDAASPVPVDLLLGHPRPIVLRRLLRDLSTIGIRRLIVTPTELGERSYLGATMWRDIRPLLIEGAAQAGVTRLMEVARCDSLAGGIRSAAGADQLRVVLHPTAERNLGAALDDGLAGNLLLAVGSERGWTGKELEMLTEAGFEVAGMGGRTLRTETAAVVAGWMAITAFAT
ncbi:MAG: RsmE family RNA methyltransferase [Spirochaetales bacterium]|nr:RsmE family RNA methyltransferase [Spirochaetales bacterium]